MYPVSLSYPTPTGPSPTGTVATTVVPLITLTLPESQFATYTYPFPLSYPTPVGPVPTGIVATTVPPPESGVGAEDARSSLDWFSPPLASPRKSKGLETTAAAKLLSTTSPTATSVGRLLIVWTVHVQSRPRDTCLDGSAQQ